MGAQPTSTMAGGNGGMNNQGMMGQDRFIGNQAYSPQPYGNQGMMGGGYDGSRGMMGNQGMMQNPGMIGGGMTQNDRFRPYQPQGMQSGAKGSVQQNLQPQMHQFVQGLFR